MKKLHLISLILSLLLWRGAGGEAAAQNLIPNGDFEYFSSCPTAPAQINRAYPWYDPNNATSDYYNACASASSNASVPCILNCYYFQNAHSGIGYCGLFGGGGNYREYIQVKLNDTVQSNKCYYVEFYANLANHGKYGINNIGAYISSTAITCLSQTPYNLIPQILLPGNPVIADTINWIKVSNIYNASGGEDYITIGNFAFDSNTVYQLIDTAASATSQSYYYIDDVSMHEIKTANIAGRDTTICHGDSVQLGIANYEGVTYSWQPAAGLSNTSIGNPYAKPLNTTTYYLTQTTPCAVTIDTVVVTLGNCNIGVDELSENSSFKLYPNPNDGNMTLEYKIMEIGTVFFTIYDITGKLVKQQTLNAQNNKAAVSASELKAGVYYYTITINDNRRETNKLVIIK